MLCSVPQNRKYRQFDHLHKFVAQTDQKLELQQGHVVLSTLKYPQFYLLHKSVAQTDQKLELDQV